MSRHLYIDFETASDVDLRKHGLMRYAKDISTRVLMMSWAFDDEPVQLWEPHLQSMMPQRVRAALADPSVIKVAHNAQFERAIIENVFCMDSPVEQWRCTMVLGYMLALPGSLRDLGKVIGLPEAEQKSKTGATLIRRFCLPRQPTGGKPWSWSTPHNEPEDWKLFCDYCVQDTNTERTIWKKLSKFFVLESEWSLWHYDQEINRRGMPVDVEFCQAAIEVALKEKARLLFEMQDLTGLANPGSTAQILSWLRTRGYPFGEMRKERVAKALLDFDNWSQRPEMPQPVPPLPSVPQHGGNSSTIRTYAPGVIAKHKAACDRYASDLARHESFRPLDEEAKAVLKLHQQASRSSWKKYQAILNYECEGRLHYQFQFAGAGRTNRWAGRGVQLQNLPRPAKEIENHLAAVRQLILDRDVASLRVFYGDVMSGLSGSIRSAIKAPHGKKFVVADLASIESRVLGWEANCQSLLDVFRNGKCAYKNFGAILFDKPYEQITKGERQIAKPPVLGCFAARTPVLTQRGWLPIFDVTRSDLVFDGVEWVAHAGVVYQGRKKVIDMDGAQVTPRHLILTEFGWTTAQRVASDARLSKSARSLGVGALSATNDCEPERSTPAPAPCIARSEKVSLPSRSSRTSAGVAVPAYDILNAGPRNRFAVLTARGPVIAHNCGYRLGGGDLIGEYPDTKKTGLWGYAELYGVSMTQAESRNAVAAFRETYPEIPQLWYDLENAALNAVRTQEPQRAGLVQFDIQAPFLRMRLPSGRFVHYLRPRVEYGKSKLPGGDVMERWQVTYEGYDNEKNWCRMSTHGGRFAEQATQAIARDVLANGMIEARDAGFWTVGMVHDELVTEQDQDEALDHHGLSRCMSVIPAWAEGLPLAAEGYTDFIYRKG